MTKKEISKFITSLSETKDRNISIIDFANVARWNSSLGWTVGIKKLGQFLKPITNKQVFRRFYYGEDYGPNDKSKILTSWSEKIHKQAQYSRFEIISKKVKYIPDSNYSTGYIKKCNLDIEMALDLFKEKDNFDTVIVFSGDGDLACVFEYLHIEFGKTIYLFGARNHIGKELIDAKSDGVIKQIYFVEDFDYRLDLRRNT